MKSSTKTNGKTLCISDTEPVRSAIAPAIPPSPTAVSAARPTVADAAPTPPG